MQGSIRGSFYVGVSAVCCETVKVSKIPSTVDTRGERYREKENNTTEMYYNCTL